MTENFLLKIIKGKIKIEPYNTKEALKLKVPNVPNECWVKNHKAKQKEIKENG